MANRHDANQLDTIRRVGSTISQKRAPMEGNTSVNTSGAPLCKQYIKGGKPSATKKYSY